MIRQRFPFAKLTLCWRTASGSGAALAIETEDKRRKGGEEEVRGEGGKEEVEGRGKEEGGEERKGGRRKKGGGYERGRKGGG